MSGGQNFNQCKEFGDFHDDSILAVHFLRTDGQKLLSLSSDGTLKLIDIRMEKILKHFNDTEGFLSHSSYGISKVMTSGGEQLAVVMTSNGNVIAFNIEKE
jgi:WD40 repeat protein